MSKPVQTVPREAPADAWKRAFAKQLLVWFRRHQRDLPWRQSADPYRVWVSEIMLQQTQVATVIPYFERFVAAFPTVADLAQATEQEVLRHWEGLGYYRRARQLHRAAAQVVERHAGEFPRDLAAIETLPGIGRYTAGAIASIAFDLPAPILEANTIRLFSRLIALQGEATSTANLRRLWQLAGDILPAKQVGQFNQALMELGSLVCAPREPRCEVCPVHEQCAAFQTGRQREIPQMPAKKASEAVREAAVVVRNAGKVLLRLRNPGERWAGLWDFLRFPLSGKRGMALQQELLSKVQQQAGLQVAAPRRIATLKHGVTRFRITLDCFAAECETRRPKLSEQGWRWVALDELEQFPLSVTGRKLGRLLIDESQRSPQSGRVAKR